MKLICGQKKLANAINNAQKAINNRTTIELLRGILFSTKEDMLTVTGYDNELCIETKIDASVSKAGKIVVNSKLVGDIIRKLPDSMVSLEVDEDYNMFISCLNSRYKIKGINAEEFPVVADLETEKMIKFNQAEMRHMIRQTVFATANEPVNPILAGELIEVSEGHINMAAVDGYRLAVRKSILEDSSSDDISVIVPGTTLNHLNSLLSDDGDFYMGVDPKNIVFVLGNTKITARLMDGNFTKYDSLLPKEYMSKVLVNTRNLRESVERAALLFSSEKNNIIKVSVSSGMMVITANNENGNAYEEINIEIEGEDLEIAFNSRYFLDGIKNIDSEFIEIELGGPVNPCIIKPVDGVEYIYLILPVRVSN